jgi:hypothetical protein
MATSGCYQIWTPGHKLGAENGSDEDRKQCRGAFGCK